MKFYVTTATSEEIKTRIVKSYSVAIYEGVIDYMTLKDQHGQIKNYRSYDYVFISNENGAILFAHNKGSK